MREIQLSHLMIKILVASALASGATIAIASEATSVPETVAVPAPNAANALPDKFTSDGSRLVLDAQQIAITPPAGWEVLTKASGMTLVMQEPRTDEKIYDKAKYQRNITIATLQRPSPIDEQRALSLKDDLTKTFGKPGLATGFQIVEHKFFDYRGKKDGLLVYSSMQLGEFQMMQMHMLVSGEARQYLLTYTDLASEFAANQAAYENAWNAMASIDVQGQAPVRYMEYVPYAVSAGVLLLVFSIVGFIRRRSTSRGYALEANEIYADGPANSREDSSAGAFTISGVWALNGEEQEDVHSQSRGRMVSSASVVSSYS